MQQTIAAHPLTRRAYTCFHSLAGAHMKARTASDARSLLQVPNVGPATVADLHQLGITTPAQLAGKDPLVLYRRLCEVTGVRHDPCVLDTLISAVRFMEGAPPLPWWHYTQERKSSYPNL